MGYLIDTTQTKERLKQAIPVKAYLSRYLEFNSAGKACCPFHDDHSPNLSCNEEKNFWYCFVCQEGGDIIKFHMLWHKENNFPKALADMCMELDVPAVQLPNATQERKGFQSYEGEGLRERMRRVCDISLDTFIEVFIKEQATRNAGHINVGFVAYHGYEPKQHLKFIKDFYRLEDNSDGQIQALSIAEGFLRRHSSRFCNSEKV